MPVHTHKEYDDKKDVQNNLPTFPVEKEEKLQESRRVIPEASPPIFVLVYPENEVGRLKNFEDTVTIGDKKYHRKCVNGAVRTTEEGLKDYLIKQGYLLIDTIKGENHGQTIS